MPARPVVRRAAATTAAWAAAWAATAALLAGCSDGAGSTSPPPEDQGASAAAPSATPPDPDVVEGLAALYTGPGADAAADQEARCFAQVLAVAVPAATLEEAGLLVDGQVVEEAPPLPEQLARQWFAAQQACADFVEVSTRAQVAATKGRLDERAYAGCLRERLSPAQVEAAVVATLTGSWEDPAVARLSDAQATCSARALPPD